MASARPPPVRLAGLRWHANELHLFTLITGEAPLVLFVGLAFLWQRRITIDIDEQRLAIE